MISVILQPFSAEAELSAEPTPENQGSSREGLGFTHLPWLMLTLLTLSACMAVFVRVSITWSLWSTTSPWEGKRWWFMVMALQCCCTKTITL